MELIIDANIDCLNKGVVTTSNIARSYVTHAQMFQRCAISCLFCGIPYEINRKYYRGVFISRPLCTIVMTGTIIFTSYKRTVIYFTLVLYSTAMEIITILSSEM